MAEYLLTLLRDDQLRQRKVNADSEEAARAGLGADEGVVLEVKKLSGAGRSAEERAAKGFALGLFLQELSALLEAGLVLTEALEALDDQRNKQSQTVLRGLLQSLYQGQPLSAAMAAQPLVFPSLLVATVAASEGSGQLPQALTRYQYYEVRLSALRQRVVGALAYPAVVMLVGMGILLFMLFFVIPRFATVFESMSQLPPTAQLMLWWSGLVREQGGLLGAGIAALALGAVLMLRSASVRAACLAWLCALPRLRDMARLFVLARFYRTAGLLMAGGSTALEAFALCEGILPSSWHGRLATALQELRAGQGMADTLARHGLTTGVAERLLRVGEQGGNLDEMCERIARFHDGTLDHAIEVFSKVFEPLLILAVGGLVGTIVTLLYMPIFELAGSVA